MLFSHAFNQCCVFCILFWQILFPQLYLPMDFRVPKLNIAIFVSHLESTVSWKKYKYFKYIYLKACKNEKSTVQSSWVIQNSGYNVKIDTPYHLRLSKEYLFKSLPNCDSICHTHRGEVQLGCKIQIPKYVCLGCSISCVFSSASVGYSSMDYS